MKKAFPTRSPARGYLFNLNSKSGFQIGIPYRKFEKAESAIKDAWNGGRTGDAARLLPYGKGYAAAVRGTLAWRPLPKGLRERKTAERRKRE